jgi:hypothetical protein
MDITSTAVVVPQRIRRVVIHPSFIQTAMM